MEIKNIDIRKSILNHLSKQDIAEIYFDYLRMLGGFKFHYVIDADEIVDYCQPFSKDSNKDIGEVADEQFIIQYLFSDSKNNAIILDDYFDEILSLRSHIMSTIYDDYSKDVALKYQETLVDLLTKVKDNDYNSDEFLKNVLVCYSFLISVSDGSYKIKLSNLNELMSKSIVLEGQKKKSKTQSYLKKYKEDVELIKTIYKDFKFKTTSESKINDIRAILKTYHLTKSAFEAKKSKKHIFYFVSSSTKDILDLKDKILNNDEEFKTSDFCFGVLANSRASLIRSKSQIFALLIYTALYPKTDKNSSSHKFLDFNRQIREIIDGWDSENGHKGLIETLKKSGNKSREVIENLAIYLQKVENLKNNKKRHLLKLENFERILSINKNEKDKKLFSFEIKHLIQKFEKILEDEFGSINSKTLFNDIKRYMKLSELEMKIIGDFLNKLNENDAVLEFDRGDDYIESIFNAFPMLFKYDFYNNHYFNILEKLEKDKVSPTIIQELTNSIQINRHVHEFIMYLLLLVKYKDPIRKYNNNLIAYRHALNLIESRESKTSYNTVKTDNSESKYLADIYAIGCWAARRARQYKNAYELSKKASNIFKDDPRFDHSLALIGFSWMYEYDTTKEYEWPYHSEKYNINYYLPKGNNSALDYCESAIQKYRILMDSNVDINYRNNYVALLNLTVYLYVIKYKIDTEKLQKKKLEDDYDRLKRKDSLQKSRAYMTEMKFHFDIIDSASKSFEWKNYPSYLHTEVFLEYFELLDIIQTDKITTQEFLRKWVSAKKDIDKAIELCGEHRYMLLDKCETLKIKIMQLNT